MRASPVTSPGASATLTPADFAFAFNCIGEVSLDERVAAAKAAGFVEIGLSCRWMRLWLQDHDISELDAILDSAGMRVGELEALRVLKAEPDPLEDVAALLAEHFRPRRLQVVGDYEGSLDDAATRLARVADRFGQWGLDVVLEPLQFTNVTTPGIGADIVARADRPNAGLCLDIWHVYRAGLDFTCLDGVWPYIFTLQMNDGTVVAEDPNLYDDCLANRRILGDGEFDIVGLLRMRDVLKPDTTFSMEVISTDLRAQDAHLTAQQIADGLLRVTALV
jgi:sugar phosphate isomerase/epimerase